MPKILTQAQIDQFHGRVLSRRSKPLPRRHGEPTHADGTRLGTGSSNPFPSSAESRWELHPGSAPTIRFSGMSGYPPTRPADPHRPRNLLWRARAVFLSRRDHEFKSGFLQQKVCELSVPERRTDRVRRPGGSRRAPGSFLHPGCRFISATPRRVCSSRLKP